MPSSQKALFLEKKLGNIVLKETEIYKPGPGEVLIKIKSTSLNPVDWKIQKLGVFVENYPIILGSDVAGDVVELGEGVTEFKKGDKVYCQGQFENDKASFQEYTLALASTLARIPPDISYDGAAALPVALSVAFVALYNHNPHGLGITPPFSEDAQGKYAGTPFVVIGGSSSVGQLVLQLAKLSGFSPIITTSSTKQTDFLKSLGATYVVDRDLPAAQLKAEIDKITGDKPIKYICDSISSETTQKVALDVLAPGGQLAVVYPQDVTVPEDKTRLAALGILRLPHNVELLETLYHDKMYGWLEKGIIKPNNVKVLPGGLRGIPDGLVSLEKGEVSGLKLVVHPQDTV
ncbi:hypothetical protein GALMADRAFT_256890 [Galerina marginata CBS 339.88]|uniref:Enoyl reductase (ER) domain-containing protein n=1 Tax=Galerina marginata (strain CBS 339.88) TaxID=685588 RepID=A0A067SLM5_GALM3|nr:hypothetical protein GALMADRAFT_256890 [Galerina marginata CBS 339.88]